jgi:hypothetical protein
MAHANSTEVLQIRAGDIIEFAHTRFDPVEWVDAMWYVIRIHHGTAEISRNYLVSYVIPISLDP